MTEIERSVERAESWHQFLNEVGVDYPWEWCIQIGLWETSDFVDRGMGKIRT